MMRGGVDPVRLCRFADWVLYCARGRAECDSCAMYKEYLKIRVRGVLADILRDIERTY
jgi:hypothetical protein